MNASISIFSIDEKPHSKLSWGYKKMDAPELTDNHSGYNEMTTHKVQQLPLNHQYQYGT